MQALLDALALPFFGLVMAHFRRVLGAAGNRLRASLRHWTAVITIVTRFALGAALKPALAIFVTMFLALGVVGVLTTRIVEVEVPALWQAVTITTIIGVVAVSLVLGIYIWDNQMLPTREIEAVETLLRPLPLGTPARAAAEEQETNRLNATYGGRAPVAFFLVFAGVSFLLLGLEFVLLSAWTFRWENDTSWTASVWTAFVGCVSMYIGARSLQAPFRLAGVLALEADKPLDWAMRVLADSGLLLLPGFTGENLGDRNKGINIPLEKVGHGLMTFGNGAMSALRWMIGVTLVALNILWMAGALIIGFVIGLGRTEQEEIAYFDTHPQVQKSIWRFWGPKGLFVIGIIGRVAWMLLSTPSHAATAPSGPGTSVVEDATTAGHAIASSASSINLPSAPPGLFSSWWHHLASMSLSQKIVGAPIAAFVAAIGLFLVWGAFDSLSNDKVAIPGKIAWGTLGTTLGLTALIGGAMAFGAQVFA